jgi:hypothetical protein
MRTAPLPSVISPLVPITGKPWRVLSTPRASSWKSPRRVKAAPSGVSTSNQPAPSIATSSAEAVARSVPGRMSVRLCTCGSGACTAALSISSKKGRLKDSSRRNPGVVALARLWLMVAILCMSAAIAFAVIDRASAIVGHLSL